MGMRFFLTLTCVVLVLILCSIAAGMMPDGSAFAGRMAFAGDSEQKRTGVFTAFTPSPEETEGDPHEMASGEDVYRGAIACPEYIKLGTKIRVEGLGVFTCEDRMGKRHRDKERFDILMKDQNKAAEFGEQKLQYEIIE
jgi:3D (Asp-Asp-Asp) domain-containing protein